MAEVRSDGGTWGAAARGAEKHWAWHPPLPLAGVSVFVWPPLYRIAHALHHRNDNTGPWSGISMHPAEHIIYLSSVLIHVLIASHPIHIFFHMHWNTIGAATTNTGYDCLLFRGKPILALGAFHHQLHHRYYHCNYGNQYMPCDKWFGTDHDGTAEAMERMRQRRRAETRAAVR